MIDLNEVVEDMGFEDVVVFKDYGYETAFIGISDDGRAVYDYNAMIEYLMSQEEFDDPIEAAEWIDYNTLHSYGSIENPPIIMYPVPDYFREEE